MEKFLLAINHPQTEAVIKEMTAQTHICVGIATYKESVISSLKETGAEILMLREELGGSMKMSVLLKNIRIECPKVRIIFICRQRDKDDEFLSTLVNLGIYDIINSNSVNVNTMVSYLMAPRTFRDVSQYFHMDGDIDLSVPKEPEEDKKTSKGGLFGFGGGKKKPAKKSAAEQETQEMQVDIAAMRAAMQEEADRRAMQNMDQLVKEAAARENHALQEALDKEKGQNDDLRTELRNKSQQEESVRAELDRVRIERDDLQRQLDNMKQRLRSVSYQSGNQVMSGSVQDYALRIEEMERKIESLQSSLLEKDRKIAQLEQQLKEASQIVGPVAQEAPKRKNPIFSALHPKPPAQKKDRQVIVFLGAKHGTGNTTLALNVATYLAVNGYKTLFVEINSRFPLINHYFSFSNVVSGVDTAVKNVGKGIEGIRSSIIMPRQISATPALVKRYAKLPDNLHFMTFSNEYLMAERMGRKATPVTKAWMDLMYLLGSQLGYSYIVVDLQPDDQTYIDLFLREHVADRLFISFTQDTHSLASAAFLLKDLMNNGGQDILKHTGFVLNEYILKHKLSTEKIGQWLGISGEDIRKVWMDRDGYSRAEMSAIPYVLTTGDHVLDYQELTEKSSL